MSMDLRDDDSFQVAVDQARDGIRRFADRGIPDAEAITQRDAGENNLSGHAHSLVPLAVHFSRSDPGFLQSVKDQTDLSNGMGPRDTETRLDIWGDLKDKMSALVTRDASVIITEERGSGRPQSVGDVADTYLPKDWGGSQDSGGGGGTVVKRTLKLLAHIQHA